MHNELKNRILTFLWSAGLMSIAWGIDYMASNLGLFNLSPELVTIIGLVAAQITKYIRNSISYNRKLSV